MKKRKMQLNSPLKEFSPFEIKNRNHISGGSTTSGTFNAGNGAGDINPADIESVTILPSAN